ncbi:hypothetical protein FQN60_007480, partial [Etheostoma spectabile]
VGGSSDFATLVTDWCGYEKEVYGLSTRANHDSKKESQCSSMTALLLCLQFDLNPNPLQQKKISAPLRLFVVTLYSVLLSLGVLGGLVALTDPPSLTPSQM